MKHSLIAAALLAVALSVVVRKKKLLLLTLLLLLLLLQKLLLLLRPLMLLLRPLLLLLTLLLRPLTLLPLLLLTLLPPPLLQKKRSNLARLVQSKKSRSKTGFFIPRNRPTHQSPEPFRECCDWPTAKHENSRHTARERPTTAEQGTDL